MERDKLAKLTQKANGFYKAMLYDCDGTLADNMQRERGKPYTDPFLKGAELQGVLPSECLVFEDGEAGTSAATAAGMSWILINKI